MVKEYRHLLHHVTLWDVAVERQVEIMGLDAFRFTNLLTPGDREATVVPFPFVDPRKQIPKT